MKLSRAIEILEKEEEDTFMGSEREWKQAIKLGGEAMRAWREHRRVMGHPKLWILPGETEDD